MYAIPVIIYTQTHHRDKGEKMAHSCWWVNFQGEQNQLKCLNMRDKQKKKQAKKKQTQTSFALQYSNMALGRCLKGNSGQEVLWSRSVRMLLSNKRNIPFIVNACVKKRCSQKATFCYHCIIDKIIMNWHWH